MVPSGVGSILSAKNLDDRDGRLLEESSVGGAGISSRLVYRGNGYGSGVCAHDHLFQYVVLHLVANLKSVTSRRLKEKFPGALGKRYWKDGESGQKDFSHQPWK